MKKKYLSQISLLLMLILLVTSCQKKTENEVAPKMGSSIDVAEAKQWFDANIESGKSVSGKFFGKGYSNTNPQWNLANKKNFDNSESYIQVPLQYVNPFKRLAFPSNVKGKYYSMPDLQLIITRDKDNKYQIQVMELMPDEKYYENHNGFTSKEDYSGLLLLKSWKGELI